MQGQKLVPGVSALSAGSLVDVDDASVERVADDGVAHLIEQHRAELECLRGLVLHLHVATDAYDERLAVHLGGPRLDTPGLDLALAPPGMRVERHMPLGHDAIGDAAYVLRVHV